MRTLRLILALIFSIGILRIPSYAGPDKGENTPVRDGDHDGLSDDFEQQILARFAPAFLVATEDCDALPAEFIPDHSEPRVLARNGTIYGQVFQGTPSSPSGAYLEVHYYHLWGRDCGRAGHSLDVEHASALLTSETLTSPAREWKAVYWYAAAHEDTVCDAGNAARAQAIGAENQGARLWISKGKHASFLSLDTCRRGGCGADQCEGATITPKGKLINLGEPGKPLNGAVWTSSELWPLAAKMRPDFDFALVAELDRIDANSVVSVSPVAPPLSAAASAGSAAVASVMLGNRYTGTALTESGSRTDSALSGSVAKAARALGQVSHALSGPDQPAVQKGDARNRTGPGAE